MFAIINLLFWIAVTIAVILFKLLVIGAAILFVLFIISLGSPRE